MADTLLREIPMELQARLREERRRKATIIRVFTAAVAASDHKILEATFSDQERWGLWRRALTGASRLPPISPEMRDAFLALWIRCGDQLRDEVNDDLELLTALRALLPPYRGGPLTLYRGDSAWNRRRRTYGLSWTTDRDIAEDYAQSPFWRSCDGGSVLLQAEAAPESIICALGLLDNSYGEDEYLVDRRYLRQVQVLQRFDQVAIDPRHIGRAHHTGNVHPIVALRAICIAAIWPAATRAVTTAHHAAAASCFSTFGAEFPKHSSRSRRQFQKMCSYRRDWCRGAAQSRGTKQRASPEGPAPHLT